MTTDSVVEAHDEAVAHEVAVALERRNAEDALARSEARYRGLVESLPVIAFSLDPTGRLTFLNSAWHEITGHRIDESVGQPAQRFLVPELHELFTTGLAALLSGKVDEQHCLVRVEDAAGDFLWLEHNSRRAVDSAGRVVGVSGTLVDVTGRRVAEEERRRLEEQLQRTQKVESLGLLAGGIAHDFNNLLMGVLGNASLALSELPPDSPVAPLLREIGTAARQAAELTRQLLAYSGKARIRVEAVSLSELVSEFWPRLTAAVSRKATLVSDLDPKLPAVDADPAQLRQVLVNLVTNASDALGEEAGTLRLRTGRLRATRDYLRDAPVGADIPEGDYVVLEVMDTGCGMDATAVKRMFDPFYSTKAPGRGLGLSAVLGIVRGHGGALRVTSTPGRGTTVVVLLPPDTRASAAD